jgi:hypothetical protein
MGAKCKVNWYGKKVEKKANTATFKTLGHTAATIRMYARQSIRKSKNPSKPGKPPHTKNRRLKDAILYYVDYRKFYAVIGPTKKAVGLSGKAHEIGGKFRGQSYPKRAYMKPAQEKAIPRMPKTWASSFKG